MDVRALLPEGSQSNYGHESIFPRARFRGAGSPPGRPNKPRKCVLSPTNLGLPKSHPHGPIYVRLSCKRFRGRRDFLPRRSWSARSKFHHFLRGGPLYACYRQAFPRLLPGGRFLGLLSSPTSLSRRSLPPIRASLLRTTLRTSRECLTTLREPSLERVSPILFFLRCCFRCPSVASLFDFSPVAVVVSYPDFTNQVRVS